MRWLERAGAIVIAIVAAVAIQRWCVVPYQCNLTKARSEQIIRELDASQGQYQRAFVARKTLAPIEACLRDMPHDIDLLVEAAACQLVIGNREAAVRLYDEALRVDRRPEIYLNLATTQFDLGRREEAIANFARAFRFTTYLINYDPNLPWSGEITYDLIPPAIREDVVREVARQTAR